MTGDANFLTGDPHWLNFLPGISPLGLFLPGWKPVLGGDPTSGVPAPKGASTRQNVFTAVFRVTGKSTAIGNIRKTRIYL